MVTDRKPLTKRQRLTLYLSQGGRCAVCGERRELDEMDDDHHLPLWNNGTNEADNRRMICREGCHKAKTAKEAKERAKVKRLSESRPRLRRKSNGRVVVADGHAKMR